MAENNPWKHDRRRALQCPDRHGYGPLRDRHPSCVRAVPLCCDPGPVVFADTAAGSGAGHFLWIQSTLRTWMPCRCSRHRKQVSFMDTVTQLGNRCFPWRQPANKGRDISSRYGGYREQACRKTVKGSNKNAPAFAGAVLMHLSYPPGINPLSRNSPAGSVLCDLDLLDDYGLAG